MAWCELNLQGSSLARTISAVLNGIASKDISGAAEFVMNLKPSGVRTEAAAAVARHWFPGWRSGKPVPSAAIVWLSRLDNASARRVLEQVQWKWSNGDAKSMAEFLATTESDRVPSSADFNLVRALVRQNPLDAMAWATRLPEERAQRAGREALAEWRRSQPDAALKWLNDLPATDLRRATFLKSEIR